MRRSSTHILRSARSAIGWPRRYVPCRGEGHGVTKLTVANGWLPSRSFCSVEDAVTATAEQLLLQFESVPSSRWLPGTVHHAASFGVYVDVMPPDEGITQAARGLVHLHETDQPAGHPVETFRPGQEVWVRVLDVEAEQGRLYLSLRGAGIPNVPTGISAFAEVSPHEWLTGSVVAANSAGAEVDIVPPGGNWPVRGFIHSSQAAGHPAIGEHVSVRVLGIDLYGDVLTLSMLPVADGQEDGPLSDRSPSPSFTTTDRWEERIADAPTAAADCIEAPSPSDAPAWTLPRPAEHILQVDSAAQLRISRLLDMYERQGS
eukprot:gnl/TRDRNA2_/TRDRNA2_147311_c0_seq1.p1 gnl/TRDRNA2_/TRDRNA2_147311_c0~~gnl/TRDRNA2_/TRDRNA2_147311_c0_seq1.p1  ORF type:complete len:317 (-),score=48.57 gnl/TRDRNA2_/TRDRNA2_147311_c0_seq1:75-1025(-)